MYKFADKRLPVQLFDTFGVHAFEDFDDLINKKYMVWNQKYEDQDHLTLDILFSYKKDIAELDQLYQTIKVCEHSEKNENLYQNALCVINHLKIKIETLNVKYRCGDFLAASEGAGIQLSVLEQFINWKVFNDRQILITYDSLIHIVRFAHESHYAEIHTLLENLGKTFCDYRISEIPSLETYSIHDLMEKEPYLLFILVCQFFKKNINQRYLEYIEIYKERTFLLHVKKNHVEFFNNMLIHLQEFLLAFRNNIAIKIEGHFHLYIKRYNLQFLENEKNLCLQDNITMTCFFKKICDQKYMQNPKNLAILKDFLHDTQCFIEEIQVYDRIAEVVSHRQMKKLFQYAQQKYLDFTITISQLKQRELEKLNSLSDTATDIQIADCLICVNQKSFLFFRTKIQYLVLHLHPNNQEFKNLARRYEKIYAVYLKYRKHINSVLFLEMYDLDQCASWYFLLQKIKSDLQKKLEILVTGFYYLDWVFKILSAIRLYQKCLSWFSVDTIKDLFFDLSQDDKQKIYQILYLQSIRLNSSRSNNHLLKESLNLLSWRKEKKGVFCSIGQMKKPEKFDHYIMKNAIEDKVYVVLECFSCQVDWILPFIKEEKFCNDYKIALLRYFSDLYAFALQSIDNKAAQIRVEKCLSVCAQAIKQESLRFLLLPQLQRVHGSLICFYINEPSVLKYSFPSIILICLMLQFLKKDTIQRVDMLQLKKYLSHHKEDIKKIFFQHHMQSPLSLEKMENLIYNRRSDRYELKSFSVSCLFFSQEQYKPAIIYSSLVIALVNCQFEFFILDTHVNSSFLEQYNKLMLIIKNFWSEYFVTLKVTGIADFYPDQELVDPELIAIEEEKNFLDVFINEIHATSSIPDKMLPILFRDMITHYAKFRDHATNTLSDLPMLFSQAGLLNHSRVFDFSTEQDVSLLRLGSNFRLV